MKPITGRLTEKNNKWYAVINLYNEDGVRKQKWIGLDLESKRGTKTEAQSRLREILEKYNTFELYKQDTMTRAEREKARKASLTVEEYLVEWLENYKCNISPLTYNGYKQILTSRIIPFFKDQNIELKDLTGDDLNDYYMHLRNNGLTGATAQRHHSFLHLAFKQAVKRGILNSNPCDRADRPKANQYIGTYYNVHEIQQLLNCLNDDPMRMAVILASYYGLRRSEVLGLKWDAIDFVENKIYIRHKIIENKNDGYKLEGLDVMKNKSSYRSLPLIAAVRDALIEEKKKQESLQRLLRGAYNSKYTDYICVDAAGNLLKPQYVTEHFKIILTKNNLKIIRFHDLRHSCASMLLANKVPMKYIQEWLGHSDMSTTANIYSHVDYVSKIETSEVLDNLLTIKAYLDD